MISSDLFVQRTDGVMVSASGFCLWLLACTSNLLYF